MNVTSLAVKYYNNQSVKISPNADIFVTPEAA